MFGIENILCLTGDHTKMGDHPQAKPVFDLDSVSLLHTVKLLESGVDLGGNELVGEPPKFSGSNTACVWKYSAPAATFLSIFASCASTESLHGDTTAPLENFGGSPTSYKETI